ncbi:MAG TPA: PAS domain S-box protein, partial [Acidimicrobiia bacterium]|nr:PAS domain S-box protein [Acidimicrobiia bacterium]
MEAGLALAAGFFAGMFVTALLLWFHERAARRAVDEASVRLRSHEARTQALLRESRDILVVLAGDGTVRYVSPAADRILGRSGAKFVGTSAAALVHPDDLDRLTAALQAAAAAPGESHRLEFRAQRGDGRWVLLEAAVDDLRQDPAVDGVVLACHDVSDRQRAEAARLEAHERFRTTFEHAPIGMALIGLDGRLAQVNRSLAQMVGRAADQLAGAPLLSFIEPDDQDAVSQVMRRVVGGELGHARVEPRLAHVDGRPVWVALTVSLVRDGFGAPLHLMTQAEDVTERRHSGERLAHQAVHDPLTGLPNRARFVEQLRDALARPQAGGRVAVLFVDLDHFKVVNDSLGHAAGDRLLVAIADRLRTATRPSDALARFAGDEFTILCEGVRDEATAFELADRVAAAVAKP